MDHVSVCSSTFHEFKRCTCAEGRGAAAAAAVQTDGLVTVFELQTRTRTRTRTLDVTWGGLVLNESLTPGESDCPVVRFRTTVCVC